MWRSMFAGTDFSPHLAVRMTVFDHLACVATIKMNIIFSFCISATMRWINNFSLGRRVSHTSHSRLFWDSWISYVVIMIPNQFTAELFFILPIIRWPVVLGAMAVTGQAINQQCSQRKFALFAFEYPSWFSYCLRIFLPHSWHTMAVYQGTVYPEHLVSFAVCLCMCRPNAFSHWNCKVKL